MIRLLCRGNVIEYTGNGWLQCSRSVTCPKKKSPKILGFDCFLYVDNLPESVTLSSPDIDVSKEDVIEGTFPIEDITKNKDNLSSITIIPVKEFVRESIKDKGNGKENRKENQKETDIQKEDKEIQKLTETQEIQKETQEIQKESINEMGDRKQRDEQRNSIILSDVSNDKNGGYNILYKAGDVNIGNIGGDRSTRTALDVKALIQKIKDAGEV